MQEPSETACPMAAHEPPADSSPAVRAEKASLRRRYRALRQSLTAGEVRAKSAAIAERLLTLPLWRESRTVLLYLSFRNEVETDALYRFGWQAGKRMLLPICQATERDMEASVLDSLEQLVPNRYGIRELPPALQQIVAPEEIDLCLIPGLAFDRAGTRLGSGAGYYDRYLLRLRPGVPRVALAYACQLRGTALPRDRHDLPMDVLITEQAVYTF